MKRERFRIVVIDHGGDWTAMVFDLEDHGEFTPYASVSGRDVGDVLDRAKHYVVVAA